MPDGPTIEAAQEAVNSTLAENVAGISDAPDGLVSEWVVVAGIVDGDGDGWVSMLSSTGLLRTHRVGLLHEALYGELEDTPDEGAS